MRPVLNFLERDLIEKIVEEAVQILCEMGIDLHNEIALTILGDNGAVVDKSAQHVKFTKGIIDKALSTAPNAFKLYDVYGNETHDLSGLNVHFTPGSAALNILDHTTKEIRKPDTSDYIQYVKLLCGLKNIASQSTAFIPSDVEEMISDSYRLFLNLLYGEKPVVTGCFTIESFEIMKNLQLAVRGSAEALKEKPLTMFSCCPTSPLKFSDVTSQNVIDCARYSIPVEFISMPLSGFMAPVTLVGTLIQHTAETISGIVISQMTNPGTPMLYGGSPAIFDVRFETTPMGAVETMMIDCAYNQIGKFFGIPTQAYISLSDAKQLDAQAGLETGMGATLAALAGINNISGPGMLDFESCQSLEKLVLDNEICGITLRMVEGIAPKEDFPSIPHLQELLRDGHLLISDHSRKYLRDEHYFPGPVIDRANRPRWMEEGSKTLDDRAHEEVNRIVSEYEPTKLDVSIKNKLVKLMENEGKRYGQEKLPNGNND
ncbi:trimethylamine methyltransferase family protein [candidate division KSB1 bacterium]